MSALTLVDRNEVRRGQGRMFPWKRHVLLVLPFLPVDLYGVYWRRNLRWVDSRTEALVGHARAVGRLGDMGASAVRIHEA